MDPAALYQGRPSAQHGTVWRIHRVGAHVREPDLGEWMCTRCGERWGEDPRPLPGPAHRTRSLVGLAAGC